jgi:hypothetical protein
MHELSPGMPPLWDSSIPKPCPAVVDPGRASARVEPASKIGDAWMMRP